MLRAAPQPVRYQVLRPFDGHHADDIIDATGWPFGRARQMTEQRYLLPLAEQPAQLPRAKTAGEKKADG